MPLNLTADMTAFQEQGYLVIPEVLGEAEVDAAQREIERLHELAAGEGSPPGERSEPHSKSEATFQFEPHTDVRAERGRPVLRKIERTDLVSDLFARMARNPRLVAVVSEILGAELLLFRSTLMLKPARHGSQHGLHQDVAYWPLEPPKLVTVSIAISASDAENGCIHVIPGSHRWPVGEWGNISRRDDAAQTDREDVDLSQLRDVPLDGRQRRPVPQQHRARLRTQPLRPAPAHGAVCVLSAHGPLHARQAPRFQQDVPGRRRPERTTERDPGRRRQRAERHAGPIAIHTPMVHVAQKLGWCERRPGWSWRSMLGIHQYSLFRQDDGRSTFYQGDGSSSHSVLRNHQPMP